MDECGETSAPYGVIKIVIYGAPVAQGRARAAVINGQARLYDPAKSRDYKNLIRFMATKEKPESPLTGPVSLAVRSYHPIPKSFSKAKRMAALSGEVRPTTKPDLKNIIAGVEDALKQIIWVDDSQVVDFDGSGKWYASDPRVEIEVREVGG